MEVTINYVHKNREIEAKAVDGAYCLSGNNGNIFISFFQEKPHIPEALTYHDSDDIPEQRRRDNVLEEGNLPCDIFRDDDEYLVERLFVGCVQLSQGAAKLLAENIALALRDMEK